MLQRLNSAVSILLSNVLPLCATSTAVAPGLVLLLMNCTRSLATSLQRQHHILAMTTLDLLPFPAHDKLRVGGGKSGRQRQQTRRTDQQTAQIILRRDRWTQRQTRLRDRQTDRQKARLTKRAGVIPSWTAASIKTDRQAGRRDRMEPQCHMIHVGCTLGCIAAGLQQGLQMRACAPPTQELRQQGGLGGGVADPSLTDIDYNAGLASCSHRNHSSRTQ